VSATAEKSKNDDKYLPTYDGGPVAGQGSAERYKAIGDAPAELRKVLPTPRQLGGNEPRTERRPGRQLIADDPNKKVKKDAGTRWQRTKANLVMADPRSIPGPKRPLVVFGLIAVFAGWDQQVLSLAGPEMQAEFGMAPSTAVLIGTITGYLAIVMGLPMGFLADRVKSRVWMVRIGMLGGQAGSIMQALAPGAGWMAAGRMTTVTSSMINGPVGFPLICDYYPSRARGRFAAFQQICGSAGMYVAGPIAGIMMVTYGWRKTLFALSVLAFIVTCSTFFLREPVRGGMDRLEAGATEAEARDPLPPPKATEAFRSAWSIRSMRRQAYASLFSAACTMPLQVISGLVMANHFMLDPLERSLLSMAGVVFMVPALLLSGVVSEKLIVFRPSMLVVMQGLLMLLHAATTVAMVVSPSLIMMMVTTTVSSTVALMLAPASMAVQSLLIPPRIRAFGMQVYTPFALIGMAFGAPLVMVAEKMDLKTGMIVFVPVMVAGAFVYLSSARFVERDINAARVAALAETVARQAKQTEGDKLLIIREVNIGYDGIPVVNGVDLDIEEGETVALLGTNGAGKSTLMRAIAGLHEPTDGAIFFDGHDITHLPAHLNTGHGIVFMPGGHAVFPTMSVRENLRTAAWTRKDDPEGVAAGIEQVLTYFPRLRERLDTRAGALSGGEQQMVALGQAFLMKPKMLMIDELSLGLAPAVVDLLLKILKEIKAAGTTIILVEQSLNVALMVAERAIFMDRGLVKYDGPTEGLLDRGDLVKAVFMGAGGAAPAVGRKKFVSTTERETVLDVRDVSVAFGGVKALTDVTLDIAAGEIVGIIGPNGAGKTTLFDVISGYVTPEAGGYIEVEGKDMRKLGPDARARAGLGRSFQTSRLFGALTVRETIAVSLERRAAKSAVAAALWAPNVRRKERNITERVDGNIELLGLERHADKYLRELSTGTRRAVDVACVMALEPKILLLDEPSSGLAQAEVEALAPTMERIVRETGCGLLVIEHDLPLLTSVSNRLIAMELGKVLTIGPPDEVVKDPQVLRSYLAASNDVIERSGSRVGAALNKLTDSSEEPAGSES
jgi:branched-chain amino acid transport system ATP-binding protein